jgi:hypothetical protein
VQLACVPEKQDCWAADVAHVHYQHLMAQLFVGVQVSEAQQQWWGFKSDNFDSVLLFKVGKFYEVRAQQDCRDLASIPKQGPACPANSVTCPMAALAWGL